MKRDIIGKLARWKQSAERKPLILTGARQVGKTWALREFGRQHYKTVAYIMFERNQNMKQLFAGSLSPKGLLPFLQAEAGVAIEPSNTLIIFDEVQAVPNALTSLKYFCEEAPEYSIIAAGSTLGVTLHNSGSFPVGQVDFMTLHPMSFNEFLCACGEEQLANLIGVTSSPERLNVFHEKLEKYLRQYFYVGGMPESVKKYTESNSFKDVRTIQKRLLKSYDEDFSKHAAPLLSTKLRMLWNSIPAQITKENKKFIYGAVRPGARARDFEVAIQWLVDSSLVNKVNRVATPRPPLKAYEDFGAFKMFVHDIGLLGAMVDMQSKAIVDATTVYTEFKGALAEQFVCQELITAGKMPYYWSSEDARHEIDFLIDTSDGIAPIEVKSGKVLASPSFKNFINNQGVILGYKLSNLPYRDNGGKVINVPLYLTSKIRGASE
jgi:predicted AAA+ superfamily ATPase